MIRSASAPPQQGSYVEIRRGARIIIGRVMWANQNGFGLSTQDELDVESIIAVPDGDDVEAASSSAITELADRRATVRHATALERSRQWSRAFEFMHHDLRWRDAWWRSAQSRNCSPPRWAAVEQGLGPVRS